MGRDQNTTWPRVGALCFAGVALATTAGACAQSEGDGRMGEQAYVHLYVAQWSDTLFNQVVRLDVDLGDSYLASVAFGRPFRKLGDHSRLEWELQAVKHWGSQDHSEVNAVLSVRWLDFPWDHVVRTTFAFGTGPSYAFSVPALEVEKEGDSAYLLQYLLAEVTGAPPSRSDWSLFLRAHHRSGTFGLVADSGSSNFIGLGIRRHF